MKSASIHSQPGTGVVCYTSFTYSYLSRALILVQTLRAAHPDWAIWAVVTDKPPPDVDMSISLAAFDRIIDAASLAFQDFRPWIFKHNVVEACTAVKARMLLHLCDQGFEKIVYLDPDIAVFHPLADIEARLDSCSIILTPHQVEPNETDGAITDNEMTSLKYGIYNLGFLAVRNDGQGRAFGRWWDNMLYKACYEQIESGIFTDQKYCDMVPALFDRVFIERDPGCNVASWNISRRKIHISDSGDVLVNGSPLKFYHFTKIEGVGDTMTERYGGANFEIAEIWAWYKSQLKSEVALPIEKTWWHYGTFSNGVPIPQAARISYRNQPDAPSRWPDPFDAAGDSFYHWFFSKSDSAITTDIQSVPMAGSGHGGFISFDEQWYIDAYLDVAQAVKDGRFASAFDHYVKHGQAGGRLPHRILVDEAFYFETYPDVRNAVTAGMFASAQVHFEVCGYREGRRPHPGLGHRLAQ